jgi:AraC family transcriptional regulator
MEKNMQPRIEMLSEKKLVGKRIRMSFADNQTAALWRSFMPLKKDIHNKTGTELYSLEVYPPGFFDHFNPADTFDKWAAIPVNDFEMVPAGLETIILPSGLYAVFLHKGPASNGPETYRHIFETWLPGADVVLDQRPHFAVMGEKYQQDSPSSEEEIWIPVYHK